MTKEQLIPAFPSGLIGDDNEQVMPIHEGMTLRDYFAIHAPSDALFLPLDTVAEVSSYLGEIPRMGKMPSNWKAKVQAKARYRFADAMLKARQS